MKIFYRNWILYEAGYHGVGMSVTQVIRINNNNSDDDNNNNNNSNNNNRIERRKSRFFWYSLLTASQTDSNTHTLKRPGHNCVQIMCITLSTHHVQHAMCHAVRRDSSATKFDRV